jgi:hypothetical protein
MARRRFVFLEVAAHRRCGGEMRERLREARPTDPVEIFIPPAVLEKEHAVLEMITSGSSDLPVGIDNANAVNGLYVRGRIAESNVGRLLPTTSLGTRAV